MIESGLKIDAATPGLSFTPTKVTFASLCVKEIPVIILLLFKFLLFVINVPDFFINEDFTSILILQHNFYVFEYEIYKDALNLNMSN